MMGRRHTFAAAMVLGSLALVSASCGSTRGRSAAAPPAVGASKPVSADTGTVAVASSSLGDVLVDAQGRTVYLFGADTGTKSACSGACALSWPPLVASGTPTVGNGAATSLVATATRTDGAQQVVYNGHPLYLFAGDQKAGDTNGQGVNAFGGSWYALTATGNQVTATPPSTGGGNGY